MREVATNPKGPVPLGFTVLRVPFFLEPGYSKSEDFEESNYDRLVRKWGGAAEFEAQKNRHGLKERGLEVGIPKFKLDRVASNTFASHRLVQWVTKTHGINKAEQLYNELNFRHFEEGQKLNNRLMLCDAGSKVGLDPKQVEEFLISSNGTEQIVAAQHMLQTMNIHSIPTFLIGGKFVTSGAAHARELVNIFRRIENSGLGAPESVFAEALGIPDNVMEEHMVFS
mmetsp:Transcript_53185/g.86121  ORF Transcript_53185/g.86121 Transcript_53185/m.86121 type:complete len:226 (-) Transcript_53185:237-914(-)|eukprot:CAMPEP_0179446170 /NCGR_PEP_ID=MMETSP0799-20121207/29587_1 /TAXON_ID=46947 /ORGANISM="Geminigera cryophila, Strain CCMP2564" /LENGTH=225 /DNA_ID=CAMNT_0021234887 /DNA_START=207 /DNA_END=884 /DNA_ORIENTATION=+